MRRSRVIAIIGIIAGAILVVFTIQFLGWFSFGSPVMLQNFSICPSNCLYTSPHISGDVLINYSAPWTSVKYFINGTCACPARNFSGISGGNYDYAWKSTSPVPIIPGDDYTLTFILTFGDGRSFTVSTSVIAGSGGEG